MAETIQEMIARKRKEKAEGKTDKPMVDNAVAAKNMNTEISTAEHSTAREYNKTLNGWEGREVVDIKDKAKDTEKSIGQKLLEDRQKRAKAKAYIESNSK